MSTPVPVAGGTIRLGQLLKLAGAVESGAEARTLLLEEEVTVNGVVETRRGRQLGPGDLVTVDQPTGALEFTVVDPQEDAETQRVM
ncbi:RNA-binding S4 domain-containing protein [Actinotalea sp. BY-33]|uniref:RNA-binding S4 domain-containing protein n=1 Tax=Actinotalea soli TaxID=2819234 RepID=A0A939RV11_9CELL|nr:RNA-binding S4 domain-containing protein [Actinotalea soli]MBO1753249.1 RNA-binding S4 domain-containing protein [Actinotalea soli]